MRLETPMEKILYCTVRIETVGPKPNQIGAGTSFIFNLTDDKKGNVPCLVTNKHVIKGAQTGRLFFTAKEGDGADIGKRIDIEVHNFEALWYGHPDNNVDVAAMPLAPLVREVEKTGKEILWSYVDQNLIPNQEQLDELDVIEDIVFVGYPNGIYDNVNLLPVFRRGVTATPPQIDYDGKPIFLVDASVFPGSSGSPVLIYNLSSYQTRKGLHTGTRIFFLGIIARVAYHEEKGTLEFVSVPTARVPVVKTKEMIDLGVVFKARTVVETVKGLLATLERPVST